MLRSLPRRFPPPVLVRLGAISLRIWPSRSRQHLPSSGSCFPLGPCFARGAGGGGGETDTGPGVAGRNKKEVQTPLGPSTPRLICSS